MNNKYDIIIVGSGLGGLFSGAILANEGKKVCVLEKHHQIGGNLQVFSRKGCHFSAGMHYAGSLEKGQIIHKIFSFLNIYKDLNIEPLDRDCFEKIIIGNKEYSYAMGMENFKNKLLSYFPEEKEALDAYTLKLQEIWEASDILNLRDLDISDMSVLDAYQENAYDYIESLTDNKELKAVLAATNGLYVGNKAKTPLFIHANINSFFINSAYRIAEDGENLASLFQDIIERNNGKVLTRKEVTGFEFEDSLISAVKTKDDEKFYGDTFISNIHPNSTFDLLEPKKLRKVYVNRIKDLENSISTFTLFIVLKKKQLKHINSNVYYSKTENVWDTCEYTDENWPLGYMMYTTEDPKNKGYAESIVVISMMKFEEMMPWEDTTINKRGDDYLAFKKAKETKLLDLLYVKFPKAKETIDTVYSASPLTYRDYTNTHKGSMYGVVKDCNDPLGTFISPKTKIPNLLLTGQNLNLHGMLGVIMTSFQTCSAIIDINKLFAKIRKY